MTARPRCRYCHRLPKAACGPWMHPAGLFDHTEWPAWGRRFVTQVQVLPDHCWQWTGRPGSGGYAQIRIAERRPVAHRAIWQHLYGEVPSGLVLDHLCRNRVCVNPAHLEPVTQRQNVARSPIALATKYAERTHCNHGHEFTPDNIYWNRSANRPRPSRYCRKCHLDGQAARRVRRAAAR